jgi:hypothetical protein
MNARPGAGEVEREGRRVLRRLAQQGATLARQNARRFIVRLPDRLHPVAHCAPEIVDAFLRRGWLHKADRGAPHGGGEQSFVLSDAGFGWLRRVYCGGETFSAQHQLRGSRVIRDDEGNERRVTVNEAESPLGWLYKRAGPDGQPLISDAQFEAGERFRLDFTLARLTPRLVVDLSEPVVGGKRASKKQPQLSETVAAARQRLRRALRAVGPAFADLLLDVCCYLIPLPDAERRRAWPKRSGRIVLALALDKLVQHYGTRAKGRARAPVRAWHAPPEEGA